MEPQIWRGENIYNLATSFIPANQRGLLIHLLLLSLYDMQYDVNEDKIICDVVPA